MICPKCGRVFGSSSVTNGVCDQCIAGINVNLPPLDTVKLSPVIIPEIDYLENDVIKLVTEERKRQMEKWGDQTHSYEQWKAIMEEEMSETHTKAICEGSTEEIIKELVQVAAVSIAWLRDALRIRAQEIQNDKRKPG